MFDAMPYQQKIRYGQQLLHTVNGLKMSRVTFRVGFEVAMSLHSSAQALWCFIHENASICG